MLSQLATSVERIDIGSSQLPTSEDQVNIDSSIAKPVANSDGSQPTHFRYLDLPAELRLLINEFVIFSDYAERPLDTREPLHHPLYYVSRNTQAESEKTYIKALESYRERLDEAHNSAVQKVLSICMAKLDYAQAAMQTADTLTDEGFEAYLTTIVQMEMQKLEAVEELGHAERMVNARKAQISAALLEINLTRTREMLRLLMDEDEREFRDRSESGRAVVRSLGLFVGDVADARHRWYEGNE
ncbi:hypothetical protein BST61_g1141 [Cercospora zeina]